MDRPRVVGILQARMGSSRLPGKVLADVSGEPLLSLIVQRLRPSRHLDSLVVATTLSEQDDVIETLCKKVGVAVFRGATEDCLDRFYHAALLHHANIVVRLTGDCPMLNAGFVDWVIEQYFEGQPLLDYVDTQTSNTFPLGLAVEVFSFDALAVAWNEDNNPAWREHVTPFIRKHEQRFRARHLVSAIDYSHIRITVDEESDLELVRRVCTVTDCRTAPWTEIVKVIDAYPEWGEMNRHVRHRFI